MCWTKWINAPDVAVVAVADVVGVVFVVFAATAVDWSQFLSISLKIKKKKIVSEQKKKNNEVFNQTTVSMVVAVLAKRYETANDKR